MSAGCGGGGGRGVWVRGGRAGEWGARKRRQEQISRSPIHTPPPTVSEAVTFWRKSLHKNGKKSPASVSKLWVAITFSFFKINAKFKVPLLPVIFPDIFDEKQFHEFFQFHGNFGQNVQRIQHFCLSTELKNSNCIRELVSW